MGLLTKTVVVKWHSNNKKWYESKGYKFTKYKDEFIIRTKDLTDGSNVKVSIQCDCCGKILNNIKWNVYKNHVKENKKYYCNNCALKLYGGENIRKTKLKNSKSFKQWCFENNRQDVLSRWDYELNKCSPDEINYSTIKKYWFKCSRGIHESELKKINPLTSNKQKNINCKKCNSFAQWGIDNIGEDFLEKYWDYGKNININPWEISYCSNKKVWIKCQEKDYHGSYLVTCNNFVNGNRCSYCRGLKVHIKDSLGQYIVDNFGEDFLKQVWSKKNKKSAFKYSFKSKQKVWWICKKHSDYYREINSSNVKDFRCPECMRERDESILQEKVRLYLNGLNYTILHERNCTIIPKNPKLKSNCTMPYDNEIVELKLIIEVHGFQHYNISGFHRLSSKKNKTTPEYELHMQQVRDRYKRMYAKSKGYYYLEIPYWADDKEETWKKLIDDKIINILNFKEVV